MATLIELKSLSKSFYNKKLLDNISFKLNSGEITTLIGQNGAGKTTLAKIILGQEDYDSGSLIIQPNIKIGYVSQKLDFKFNMPITSQELLHTLAPNGLDNNIVNIEEFIGYNKIKNQNIANISGGELQKLFLLGTLMNKPDLLILDEPTQFLDLTSQYKFYQTIVKLKNDLSMTVFIISHHLFTVMKNSDQVICLNKHVCCIGKPIDMEKNDIFKEAMSEIGVYVHNHDHDH